MPAESGRGFLSGGGQVVGACVCVGRGGPRRWGRVGWCVVVSVCWWMSGGWRGGWWAIGGGPAPAKRDFDGGKNDSKAKNRKRNGRSAASNYGVTKKQPRRNLSPLHPSSLATQHPRSGTPHHTNSESIAHAPKATGSGEIEATIARQHKSSASHATIEIVAATSQEPCHQSRLRFGGVLVRSVGLAVDTMLPQNLNAGSRAEN